MRKRNTCTIPRCRRFAHGRGWCLPHYKRWMRWGDPLGSKPKTVPKSATEVCSVHNCGKPYLSRGLCRTHYERWRVHGDPLVCLTREQGTGTITEKGHIRVQIGTRLIREHRGVMEKILGRPLRRDEIVHHINGNPADNRPENLAIMSRGAHTTLHKKGKPATKG